MPTLTDIRSDRTPPVLYRGWQILNGDDCIVAFPPNYPTRQALGKLKALTGPEAMTLIKSTIDKREDARRTI